MNAEILEFPDQSFDLVFGSSILHHLNLDKAYAEIERVLRPGGCALFIEPFGHNVLINAYRNRTPSSRTEDEHPLLWRDLELSRTFFSNYAVEPYGLMTLAITPFRKTKLREPLLVLLRTVDKMLFKIPAMQKQAWVGLLQFSK
jgi:ubiquinone/menaquinone biosynthesis C-methylase UbiE